MNALKTYITRHYIKVSALAEEADIPRTTLYNYMSGTGDIWNMTITTFIRLAHALGMTADELVAELEKIEREEYRYAQVDINEAEDGDDTAAGQK